MAKRVAVAIGVRRAGTLTELPGAVNGATQFCEWADKHGYQAQLITDDVGGPVTSGRLQNIIKAIVDEGEAERLLIYFAGHGIQPSFNTAYWLLSNWEAVSEEAVNVSLSFSNAKRSGIAQIAVFADACRSTVPDAASVGGSSIFPKQVASVGKLPQWDLFMASRLGEVAQEVAGTDPTKAFGIFTQCVMRALWGSAPKAIKLRAGQEPARAVTSAQLADFLEEEVPLVSGKTPGAAVQLPEASSGWRDPRDVYLGLEDGATAQPGSEIVLNEVAEFQVASDVQVPASVGVEALPDISIEIPVLADAVARNAVAAVQARNESAVQASMVAFAAAKGRDSFESGQGLTIVGAKPIQAIARKGASIELFAEGNAYHVRGHGREPQTVAIELENGNWIGACVMPELAGTIAVSEGVVASVNYAPSLGGRFANEISTTRAHIAPAVSLWNALMRQGRVPAPGKIEEARAILRQHKYANPALGVMAAYASERTGDIEAIDAIAACFHANEQAVPFDIAMLAIPVVERTQGGLRVAIGPRGTVPVAGSFPLMTQGWAYLDPDDAYVSPQLLRLRRGLLPSLWTTLRSDEGRQLAKLLENGEL